jgi:hypothetical protein
VGDVGNDHFHDFVWEAADRSVRGGRITEEAIDVGFASTPNDPHPSREAYPYGANGTEVRGIHTHLLIAIPGTEDTGPLERPVFPVAGGFVIVVGVRGAPR